MPLFTPTVGVNNPLLFFKGDSVDPGKLWLYHESLIKNLWQENKILVTALMFDFGTNNQGMCRDLGVHATKREINVTIEHPGDPSKMLVMSTDPSHSLKGIKRMALSYEIQLPNW
jgi:hypothetical protein